MGSGNPPDKPGYLFFELSGDFSEDQKALNEFADQDYRVEEATTTYILLANYKKDS